jgi:hypothetical protein
MSKKSCLNCGHSISGEFCAHCGQKSDTARITLHSLIKNDILGSVWHVEAKFFHTLKNLLFRPGITAGIIFQEKESDTTILYRCY